jgi:hypothetical protein
MKNKTISWKRATDLLQKCSAVEWGDGFVTCPAVFVGDENRVELSHLDEEGQMFEATFVKANNEKVTVSHSLMFLTDTEGNEEQISLLGPQKIS